MYTFTHKFKPGDVLQNIVGTNCIYLIDAVVLNPYPWYKVIELDEQKQPIFEGETLLFSVLDVDENWTLYEEKPVKTFSPDITDWNDIVQYIIQQLDKVRDSKKKFDRGCFAAYNDIIELMADIEESRLSPENHEYTGAQLESFSNCFT